MERPSPIPKLPLRVWLGIAGLTIAGISLGLEVAQRMGILGREGEENEGGIETELPPITYD